MRRYARLGVVLALVTVATWWTRPAFACSCAGPPPFEQAVAEAELVFDGEILAYLGEGKSEVRVDRVYKGQTRALSILHTDLQRFTSCAVDPPSARPIVYAGPSELTNGQCQGTLWAVRDVALPSYDPLPGADDRGGGGWVSAIVALLGVAALPLARTSRADVRRRRRAAADLAAWRLAR